MIALGALYRGLASDGLARWEWTALIASCRARVRQRSASTSATATSTRCTSRSRSRCSRCSSSRYRRRPPPAFGPAPAPDLAQRPRLAQARRPANCCSSARRSASPSAASGSRRSASARLRPVGPGVPATRRDRDSKRSTRSSISLDRPRPRGLRRRARVRRHRPADRRAARRPARRPPPVVDARRRRAPGLHGDDRDPSRGRLLRPAAPRARARRRSLYTGALVCLYPWLDYAAATDAASSRVSGDFPQRVCWAYSMSRGK